LSSEEGEISHPPSKKARVSSEKTVTAEVEEPVLPEETSVVTPPPKKALEKRKESASATAHATSAPEGHVSVVVVVFLFTTVLTRVALEPTIGCSLLD
jgi:hypothetical protein